MIPLNQEQHLGKKAYTLMVSRKLTPGLVIILIAAVVLVLQNGLTGFVAGMMTIGGANGTQSLAGASIIMQWIVLMGFIIGLAVCILGIFTARFEYTNYTFTFEEFGLKLKRGIIGTRIISIPYRQMQNINLERSLIHRMTGTTRVTIDSAGEEDKDGHDESEITLEPIDVAVAEDIRLILQRKIGVQVTESEAEADREAGIAAVSAAPSQTGDNRIV
ncbi:MAG: PH domain-containing protein [Candidatus Paceibacterota bacterium]